MKSNVLEFPTAIVREEVYINRMFMRDRPVRCLVETSIHRPIAIFCSEMVILDIITDEDIAGMF